MIQGTYEIVNKLDGMAYGGSSGNIKRRWRAHLSSLRNDRHHCGYFQNAWNKYGEDVFEFIMLEVIEDPVERIATEQIWLDIHHAAGTCYNSAITAGPAGPPSEETKHKIGDANRGKKRTEEQNRAQSERMAGKLNPNWGKDFTEEHRRKIGVAHIGNQHCLGYKHTDEYKQALSERMLGNQNRQGCKHTEESKYKIGKASARPYPAFIHKDTGGIVPAGVNLSQLCRGRGLGISHMAKVKNGKQICHKGWMLLTDLQTQSGTE